MKAPHEIFGGEDREVDVTTAVNGACRRTWPKGRKRKKHRVYRVGRAGVCLNCGKGFVDKR